MSGKELLDLYGRSKYQYFRNLRVGASKRYKSKTTGEEAVYTTEAKFAENVHYFYRKGNIFYYFDNVKKYLPDEGAEFMRYLREKQKNPKKN